MLYTEPNINLNSFYEDPETPRDNQSSLGDILSSTYEQIKTGDEYFSSHYNLSDVYDDHIERVKKLTGQELANPQFEYDGREHQEWAEHKRQGGTLGWRAFERQWYERKFRSQLSELVKQRPELRDELLPALSFQEQAYQKARQADERAREVWERSDQGTGAHLAWLAGTGAAALTDPVNYLTAPIGFSGAATGAKGLAMAFLKNGAANAAVETGIQFLPGGIRESRTEAGMYAGLDYTATSVGGAFVFGGGLDVAFRGIARGLHYGLGYQPVVKNDIIVGWQKPGKAEVSADLVKKADSGDAGAIRELAEKTELAENPVVRNTLDAMDADERLAQKPTVRTDRAEPRAEILDGDHASAVKQSIRTASDPDIEPPMVRVDEVPEGPDIAFERFVDYAKRVDESIDERIAQAVDEAIETANPDAPIVIARAFREHPALITNTVPFDDARFSVGRQLARLSDEAFERVESGEVSGGLGRLVADHVADPADHVKVLDFLQQVDPSTEDAARMAIGEMIQSPEIRKPAPDTQPAVKLPEKQLDDPHGPQARQQVDELEAEFAEELGRLSDEAVSVEEAAPAMTARADDVRAAIDEIAGVLPEGTEIRTFDSPADLPDDIRAHVELSHAVRFADAQKRFQSAESDAERLAARAEMDDAKAGRLVEALEGDGTIWIANWAIDPKGRVAHEALHALVERGLISPEDLALLARVAREAGVFGPELEARYRSDFNARSSGQAIGGLLDEEAAAHLLEAFARGERPTSVAPEVHGVVQRIMDLLERIGNALRSRGFVRTIDAENSRVADLVDEFLSGEMARRPEVQEWMRSNQTGQTNLMHAIRAYHGSPHDFDKFKMSQIGTGEGAQAYGHGLYFAENPKVAKDYQETLTRYPVLHKRDGTPFQVNNTDPTKFAAANFLKMMHGNFDMQAARNYIDDDAIQVLKKWKSEGVTTQPNEGRFYEVNIKANKEDFLDWDKPLSGQSQSLRSLLETAKGKVSGRAIEDLEDVLRIKDQPLGVVASQTRLFRPEITQRFKEAGIPGIKYLDQGSRGKGSGSYNYVVFDEDLIEITAKDGQPVTASDRKAAIADTQEQFKSGPMFAMRTEEPPALPRMRALDDLGYYSKALEAAKSLKQTKGTPEQMLAQLKKAGVKQAEIEATGLDQFLEGQKSVTRDGIVSFLGLQRVQVNATRYGGKRGVMGKDPSQIGTAEEAKWSEYSLDPSNPTYRETVLHLPRMDRRNDIQQDIEKLYEASQERELSDVEVARYNRLVEEKKSASERDFRSGHWDEFNVIAHLRTSIQPDADGKQHFVLNELQSDWGQKIRDTGAVRDEAKLDELRTAKDAAKKTYDEVTDEMESFLRLNRETLEAAQTAKGDFAPFEQTRFGNIGHLDTLAKWGDQSVATKAQDISRRWNNAEAEDRRLRAELSTAEQSAPGHPLVNTTDQWVNTALRRMLRQAVDENADYITIASGETVDSFGMGAPVDGLKYAYNEMYPKKLRDILKKIDKDAAKPDKVSNLKQYDGTSIAPRMAYKIERESGRYVVARESAGGQVYEQLARFPNREQAAAYIKENDTGLDFTSFPLTAKVKEQVLGEGLPLFAMRSDQGRAKFGAKERAEQLKADLEEIESRIPGTDGDQRAKLQSKRAALLNAKAQERILDDISAYKDQFGRTNRAKGFMFQIESYGEAAAQDLKHTKEVIEDKAQAMLSEVLWEFRKGMITGDKRRSIGPVKKRLENMIRAAAGEEVDDPQAVRMAHAWLKVAEYLRKRFNAAGGDIRKLAGWYLPQFHDAEALLKATAERWINYMMQDGVLDWGRMGVEPGERQGFLMEAFKTITSDGANKRKDVEGLGRGALYKRHNDHRVLHFASADAWLAYNKLYGGGDIYAAMLGHISMMARDIAMLERFGANPNVVFDRVANTLRNDALTARTASSLLDDLDAELARLKTELGNEASPTDAIMKRMGEVHKELDTLRRKGRGRFQAGKGKIGKRIYELDMELMELHDQMRTATAAAETGTQQRIAGVLDRIEAAEQFSATSRNPVESTEYYIRRANEMFKAFKGDSSVPVSNGLAKAMSASRNLVGAGILSGASISALTDQTISMAARTLNGMPVRSQISSFLKGFTVKDRKLAMEAAIGLDQVRVAWQEQARYLGNVDARGVTGFLADRTHAYSFLSPMTQAAKVGFSLDFMRFMVRMQEHQWTRLPAPAKRMLERHGFTAEDWGQIRSVKPTDKKMSTLLTRDNIADALGEDMAERYAVMMLRERGGAVLESTLRGRTLWVSDQQPGTLLGEITRSVAMLKSFPTSFSFLVLNRLYREMSSQGLLSSAGGYAAFVFLGGTILGGLVIQLKNLAHGRDPNDMTNGEFWWRAALQSGGMGIYGDFVNSSSNRFGGGLGGTLLGPMGDFVSAPASLVAGNVIRYARDEPTNPGREAANIARKYTPVIPFYMRLAYDRLVIDKFQMMADPKYHESFRSKVNHLRRSRGQQYYWPPGQGFDQSRMPDVSRAVQR